MSLDREILRLKRDPVAFRALAKGLLTYAEMPWTEWERDFLEAMAQRGDDAPSTRQCEKILELIDNTKTYRTIAGLSVRLMIENTWRAKDELEEDDEEFMTSLYETGAHEIKRGPLKRLLVCARKVDVIHTYIHLD